MRMIAPELDVPCFVIAEEQEEYKPVTVGMVVHPSYGVIEGRDHNALISAWRPSAAERALLVAGEDVYISLLTFGGSMQPINVLVGKAHCAAAFDLKVAEGPASSLTSFGESTVTIAGALFNALRARLANDEQRLVAYREYIAHLEQALGVCAPSPAATLGEATEPRRQHEWLGGLLHAVADASTNYLREELKPRVVLGQTTGVFDVERNDGTWVRVSVSPSFANQAELRASATPQAPEATAPTFDYPAAARSIALNLAEFCDESLAYPEMIADVARKADAALTTLRAAVAEWWDAKNLYWQHEESDTPEATTDFRAMTDAGIRLRLLAVDDGVEKS